jgi:hypothetical protein
MAAVKKKVVKKAIRFPAQLEAERKFADYVDEMEKRGRWASKIFRAQDEKTQNAIQDMIDVISSMADPKRTATVKLDNGDSILLDVPDEVFENGWLWVAVRLCVAAHEWDIRVANFKPIRKRSEK